VGLLYSLVICGVLAGYRSLGAQSWAYSAVALFWATTSGLGFKTNPGSVFACCLLAVLFYIFFGFIGNGVAWLCFWPFLLAMLRVRSSKKSAPDSVVIDVDAEK
jgi:hypothetical protein